MNSDEPLASTATAAEAPRSYLQRWLGLPHRDAEPALGQLTAELLGLHARILLRMPLFQIVLVAAFGWIALPHVAFYDFADWAAFALAAEALRAGAAKATLLRLPRLGPTGLARAHALFIALDALAGLSIGLVALLFLPRLPLLAQMLVETTLFTISAAGASVALSSRYVLAAYSSVVLLCAGVSWDRLHQAQAPVVTVLTLLYWAFLLGVARDAEQLLARSIRIRAERDQALHALEIQHAELVEAKHRLDRATQERSRILAATSHDLRQPLQALSIYSAVLSARPGPQALEAVGRNIESIVRDVGDMLDNLVDLARLSAGSYPLKLHDFRLDALVRRTSEAFAAAAAAKELLLACSASQAILLHGNATATARVLRNLLDNAVKYTERGRIDVDMVLLPPGALLSVTDTGPGIEAAQQQRIFEEFYRGPSQGEAQPAGAGLGLAIVHRLCEALGARLEIHSEPGVGTRFSVWWPQARTATDADAMTPTAPLTDSARQTTLVFVIDDDHSVAASLTQLLDVWGYRTGVAHDPAGAQALFEQFGRPALLITDLRLGQGVDGLDLAARWRDQYGEFAMLAISGEEQEVAEARAHRASVTLLHKPVSSFKLRLEIARALADTYPS